jgi:hypothetical protein
MLEALAVGVPVFKSFRVDAHVQHFVLTGCKALACEGGKRLCRKVKGRIDGCKLDLHNFIASTIAGIGDCDR